MRLVVIGIGSPFGDDAAGWRVAERLRSQGCAGAADVQLCARPVPDLVEALAEADAAVLIDATRFGLPPGTVHTPAPERIGRGARRTTHGLGVGDALALAAALGHRPRLALVGIEAREAGAPPATPLAGGPGELRELSPAVAAALAPAAARVRARCAELCAQAVAASGAVPDAGAEVAGGSASDAANGPRRRRRSSSSA